MECAFVGRLRSAGNSLVVTVPNEIVEKLTLKEGQTYQLTINAELSEPKVKEGVVLDA